MNENTHKRLGSTTKQEKKGSLTKDEKRRVRIHRSVILGVWGQFGKRIELKD